MSSPARVADAGERVIAHRRFSLREVTLAGLPVGGATIDAWRDAQDKPAVVCPPADLHGQPACAPAGSRERPRTVAGSAGRSASGTSRTVLGAVGRCWPSCTATARSSRLRPTPDIA